MNVNKAIVVGRVTKDPDVRVTKSGQQVASFSVATNQFWTTKNGTKAEKTEFHNVVLWGRLAEIVQQYLVKGQECYIEGKMQTREYDGKDGVKRRITEIVGETLQLGSRPNNAKTSTAPQKSDPVEQDGDIETINLDEAPPQEVKIEDVPF